MLQIFVYIKLLLLTLLLSLPVNAAMTVGPEARGDTVDDNSSTHHHVMDAAVIKLASLDQHCACETDCQQMPSCDAQLCGSGLSAPVVHSQVLLLERQSSRQSVSHAGEELPRPWVNLPYRPPIT